jgi:hypothetical protein
VTAQDPFEVLGIDRAATLDAARLARRRLAFERHPDRGGDADAMLAVNAAFEAAAAHITARRLSRDPTHPGRVQFDGPSFVIAALPAEAFEALLVVTSWIGEVLVDEPPYLLEVHLYEPTPCWCRLDLVPNAGSSTVSITVAPAGTASAPSVDDVRDVWVANLNQPGAFS